MPAPRPYPSCAPIAAALVLAASATDARPLDDLDNGVLSGLFHLPSSSEDADLVGAGESRLTILVATSSHSTESAIGVERLELDGETTRARLGFRHGVSPRLELGIDVPWVWHSPGNLDSLIDGWHDLLGLPEGDRVLQPDDRLRFLYDDGSDLRLNVVQSSSGVGDVRLTAGWQVAGGAGHDLALRFGATIPTGDSEKLHGSGAVTASAGLAGNVERLAGNGRLSAFYALHATWLGEPDWLPDRYRELVGLAAAGIGVGISSRVELAAQGMLRTAMYDSRIEMLGEPAVVLTFGGNVRLSPSWLLSLAVGEDVKVESAPDVTFRIGIYYEPDGF